ncbi:MAG: porin [Salibacteraceae bacterium]|nr:porin [Salibacteraceae bacterium]
MKPTLKKLLLCLCVLSLSQWAKAQQTQINSYRFGEGLNFVGKDDYKVELSGYVQPTFESKFYTDTNDANSYNRFRIRRLRIRLAGDMPKYKMTYRLQVDLSGNSEVGDQTGLYLLDAWIGFEPIKNVKLIFGQHAAPTDNRELTMSSHTLQLVERSRLTSSFASIREFGFFAQGSFKTGGGTYLKPYFSVTNGDGKNIYNADYGGLKVGGRVDFLPFGLFTNFGQFRQVDIVRENTPKLVIGGTYSYTDGLSSRRGRESGAILYLNDSGAVSLPDFIKYGADFLFKYKGWSVLGEFMGTAATVPADITQRVRVDGTTSTTFDVDGVQDVENYIKGRMMLGKGYNIQVGYLFKMGLSIDARYTHIQSDEYSFLKNGTFYNRPDYYTLGLSKYFGRNYAFKVQGSFTYAKSDPGTNNIYGLPMDGDELIYRLGTTFSF